MTTFEEAFADALAGVPDEQSDRERFVPGAGSFDADATLDTDGTITNLRGREFERDGRTVRATFHPAAALYDRSTLPTLTADLRGPRGAGRVSVEGSR
jgi:hypothetical protein